jgi:DNA-binding IclR family transcriptional regulator
MPFSSTHVLLQTLVQLRFAEVSAGDRQYTPGPRLARLGVRVVSRLDLLEVARPRIASLASQIDEDVYVALYHDTTFSHIERVESGHSLRLNITLGVPRPLHSTAVGKLFLASLARAELDTLLSEMELTRFTPYTITQRDVLMTQLERVRQQGFASSDQESIEGVTSTAAPVYNSSGRLMGAVSTPIPRSRYLGREEMIAAAVVATAAAVSAALGWVAGVQTLPA